MTCLSHPHHLHAQARCPCVCFLFRSNGLSAVALQARCEQAAPTKRMFCRMCAPRHVMQLAVTAIASSCTLLATPTLALCVSQHHRVIVSDEDDDDDDDDETASPTVRATIPLAAGSYPLIAFRVIFICYDHLNLRCSETRCDIRTCMRSARCLGDARTLSHVTPTLAEDHGIHASCGIVIYACNVRSLVDEARQARLVTPHVITITPRHVCRTHTCATPTAREKATAPRRSRCLFETSFITIIIIIISCCCCSSSSSSSTELC